MALQPQYTDTAILDLIQISAANTNRDGSGTTVLLVTGATGGTLIETIQVKAVGTTTAGMIRIFISKDSGTTKRLKDEISVSAITPSAIVKTFEGRIIYNEFNFILEENDEIYISTHNAETFNVFATGGNF